VPGSPTHILKLVEGMESRSEKGFRVSPETAVLVIDALRHYARDIGASAAYKVEKWDASDQHVEEVLARASLIMIGRAAFAAAVEQYPGARQGIRVIDKT